MAWIDTARNITEGFAQAAGAKDAAAGIEAQKQRQQGFQDLQRQQAIQQAQAASLNIADTLRSGVHPDTGQPLSPQERDDLMHANHFVSARISDLFDVNHPVDKAGPAMTQFAGVPTAPNFLRRMSNDLHITKPQPQAAGPSSGQAIGNVNDIISQYGAPADTKNPYTKMYRDLVTAGENPDTARSLVREKMRKDVGEHVDPAENWQNFTLTLRDGTQVPVQKNTKDGRVTYLDQTPVPSEVLRGAQGTVRAGAAPKGLAFLPKTGMVQNKDTGQLYSPGDPNNPPEVQSVFKNAKDTLEAEHKFVMSQVIERTKGYGAARLYSMMPVLDLWNGNAPTMANGLMMLKDPNRYAPASAGAQALAAQNFMGDIQGAAKTLRDAIGKVDFSQDMRAKIAVAMQSEERGAVRSLVDSNILGQLTPEQRDFLIAVGFMKEQAMSLRSTMKTGAGSDQTRQAIFDILPGVLSPDRDYANRQLDQFDAQLARVQRGIPKMPLNESASTAGLKPIPKGSQRFIVDQGGGKPPRVFTIKDGDVPAFKKDFPNARPTVQ